MHALSKAAGAVRADLQPYSSPSCPGVQRNDDSATTVPRSTFAKVKLEKSKAVVADRLKFEALPTFDPLRFFGDSLLRAAYLNPAAVRLPCEFWGPPGPTKVRATGGELLKLLKKWDHFGMLRLLPTSSSERERRCGSFAVGKDQDWDRHIINPFQREEPLLHFQRGLLADDSRVGLMRHAHPEGLRRPALKR